MFQSLESLRAALAARAAGHWRVSPSGLELVEFRAAPDLDPQVAREFAEATRLVSLSQTSLGIVRAAVEAVVSVSRLAETSPDQGSGLWLRRFGAERSVAVPVLDAGEGSRVVAVVSVAVGASPPDDGAVAEAVRQAAGPR